MDLSAKNGERKIREPLTQLTIDHATDGGRLPESDLIYATRNADVFQRHQIIEN
jgi:hypothetical protein